MEGFDDMLTRAFKIVPLADAVPDMTCRGLVSPDGKTAASCRDPSRRHLPRQPPCRGRETAARY